MEGNPVKDIRVFLALPLPDFTALLRSKIDSLRLLFSSARWTEPKDLHITLHFFGSIASVRLSELCVVGREAAADFLPFKISLQGFGVFPDYKNPIVLWAGISEGRDELLKLHTAMEARLEALGFKTEKRPFFPHVTLGRLLNSGGRIFPELPEFPATEPAFLREAALYESILGPKGSRYDVLERFPFSK